MKFILFTLTALVYAAGPFYVKLEDGTTVYGCDSGYCWRQLANETKASPLRFCTLNTQCFECRDGKCYTLMGQWGTFGPFNRTCSSFQDCVDGQKD